MTYKLVKLHKFINDLTEERKIEITDFDIIEEPTLKTKTHSLEVKKIVNWSNIKVKKRVLLKEWDLVFAKLHTQNWAFAFAKKDFKSTTTFIPCKVDISQCREDFLYIVLDKYIKFLEITNDWVWRETFKSKDILNLEIPLPTLEEQEKIVKKIESINEKIEKIKSSKEKNNIKILKEQILKQAIEWKLVKQDKNDEPASILLEKIKLEKEELVKEWKLKKQKELPKIKEDEIPFEIPENWVWCRLNDILSLELHSLKRWPFWWDLTKDMFVDEWYLVYEQRHAIHNDFKYKKYFVTEEKYRKMLWFSVLPKDLIISCSWATLWRISEIPENASEWIINQALLKIRINKKFLINKYFIEIFRSNFIQNHIIQQSQWSAIPNMIWLSELRKILIPIPPLEEQKRIVEKIEEFEEKLSKLDKLQTKQLRELEALKNAVLDKALRGDLIK